jgi:hypothetical protein
VKTAKVALASLGLLALSGLAYGGQVLVNGDFAGGTISPWFDDTRDGTGTGWLITSTNCFSGSYCVVDTGNVGLEQTFAGVATTAITDVSLYMSGGIIEVVDFFYQGGGDDEFVLSGTPTAVSGWEVFDATSDLRASGTLIGFEAFGNSGTTPTLLDDLSITTIPEPSGLMLALAGLVGLAFRMRSLQGTRGVETASTIGSWRARRFSANQLQGSGRNDPPNHRP